MSAPLVSVVLPAWNGERFLGEALESVGRQGWRSFEIVVVDDGSTDASGAIAGAFPGVRLLRQARAGVAAARNRGVDAARGELIAFLDQDDRFTPDKLERQVGAFLAEPALDLCFAHQRLFLDGISAPPPWVRPGWLDGPLPGLLPGTLVVRRRAFDAVGPFAEGEPIARDSDWLMRARSHGLRERLLPDVLLERRIHAANQSADVSAGHLELLRAVRRAARRGAPPASGASA
jgi:glycosyltransferase involved in cell wall biosynthesis